MSLDLSMRLPKNYSRRIWRALMEFEMLEAGDRVLVGLSGGKDSALLLYALCVLKQQSGFPFTVGAATIDAGFAEDEFREEIQKLCTVLDVPLYYERHEELSKIVFDPESKQSPCARCAFFRRGMLNRIAKQEGYNKIALGHHLDDAVETFLMSILYSGKIQVFTPVTDQDRSELTVIRPLCLLREKEIVAARRFFPWQVQPSCCPQEDKTTRLLTKNLIKQLGYDSPQLFARLVSAMRRAPEEIDLWPPQADSETMRKHYINMVNQLGREGSEEEM